MNLSLVFLIFGGFLLSCSLQQQVLFRSSGWNPYIFPRTKPFYYYADQYSDAANGTSHQLYEVPSKDVQKNPAVSSFFKLSISNKHPQSRLFGFMLYNQLKNSLLSSLPTVTFTSTSTFVSTSVSTITTLALQNCISIANFAVAPGAGGVYSTAPCSRKKRSIELDAVEPSKVIPMEISRVARSDDEKNSEPNVLSSSLLDLQEESDVVSPRKVGFSQASPIVIPKSTLVVTATATTTSFFFAASTVKKPFTLAAAAVLTCLPPGFVVC